MEEINKILQAIRASDVEKSIDEEYDAMVYLLMAEHNMQMYACHSYDNEQELTVGYFKNKIIDVMEMLEETGMDFELVAKKSGLLLREVKQIAHDYMDIDVLV